MKDSKSLRIMNLITQKIDSGELTVGSKMPSIRQFCVEEGISHKTAVRIYDQLQKDQYLVKVHGKGTYVKTSTSHTEKTKKKLKSKIPRTRFINSILSNESGCRYHFVDTHQSHYLVPYDFINDLSMDINRKILSDYSDPLGLIPLRESLISLLKADDINVGINQVMITNGVQQGINIIARSFIARGDHMAMSNLSFPAASDVFNWQGAMINSIQLESDGIDLNQLNQLCMKYKIRFLYLVPNFNNPTGCMMSLDKKRALLALASNHDFFIIEDDSWGELYLGDRKPASLKSMDADNRVIYLKGFTKTLGAGFRIAAIVGDPSIISELLNAKVLSDLGSPIMTQLAVCSLLKSHVYAKHLSRIREDLRVRIKIVDQVFKNHLPPQVGYMMPDGGPNIWVTLPKTCNSKTYLEKATKNDLIFGLGHVYYTSKVENNTIRLSIVNIDMKDLEEGLRRFCNLFSDLL